MNIRPAVAGDLPAIHKLHKSLFSVLAELMPDTFKPAPYLDGFLEDVLVDEKQEIFVAELAGSIIGYALVQDKEADTASDATLVPMRYTYLLDFCVAPGFRGQGTGARLFDQVRSWAKEHDAYCIELSVAAPNVRSIALYERLGFFDTVRHMRCML